MSFPGISRVLNRFMEWVRTQIFFRHPRKNQSRKPNAKSTKPRSNRGEKTTSVIFQRSRLDKKSQRWENLGEEEDFPALSRQEGHGRPGAPARGWSIAPGADTREGTPAPVGSAGWLLGGVEMNSLLSQNTLNEKVGSEGGGEED